MAYTTLDLVASRRRILGGAATTALAALLLSGLAQTAAASAKSPQKAVEYQTHPKGGKGCNTCRDFQPPQSCKTVESPVQASGWCDKYVHS